MFSTQNSHQYNYSPVREASAARKRACVDVLYVVATVAVFAFIGVLLAWRG